MTFTDAGLQGTKYTTAMAKVKMPDCPKMDQMKLATGLDLGHSTQACSMAMMIARIDLEKQISPACYDYIEVEGCKHTEVKHFITSMATLSKEASSDPKCPKADRVKMATGYGHDNENESNACMMARFTAQINMEKTVHKDCHKYITIGSCKKH